MVPFSEQSGIITSVMDGGANINLIKNYIIEDGEENLLGVSPLTEKNIKVVYEFNSVTIIDCNEEVLMVGPYDPKKRLFYVDLLELIMINRNWEKRLVASGFWKN